MATTTLNKTLTGGLVDCHILQEQMLGGLITRETRTLYTTPHHPWQNYRRRTTTSYGFRFPLPQVLMHLVRMDDQYAALLAFVGLAAF